MVAISSSWWSQCHAYLGTAALRVPLHLMCGVVNHPNTNTNHTYLGTAALRVPSGRSTATEPSFLNSTSTRDVAALPNGKGRGQQNTEQSAAKAKGQGRVAVFEVSTLQSQGGGRRQGANSCIHADATTEIQTS